MTWLKSLTLLVMCVVLASCSGLKEFVTGDAKNQLEAVIAVATAGLYELTYTVKKNGSTLLSQTIVYECTQADGKLTGCHKRNPAPAALVP